MQSSPLQSPMASRVRARSPQSAAEPPRRADNAHARSLAQLPDGLSAEQLRRSLEGIPSTMQGAPPALRRRPSRPQRAARAAAAAE